jgi:iron complex outermembrane receptor protein
MKNNSQQQAIWCFRHWSRKPWAAFSGMCRFKYGHLSVAMSIILLATDIAGAQTVGEDSLAQYRTLHLDAVQVSARQSQNRFGQAADNAQLSQTRFLVDQKGFAPVASAEAVLRLVPAVDIRERGGRSTQADIAIRGGSFDQTMVMLNGIDFSDARTGHQSHALPVDLDLVSDIAVLEGAARPGALAGAVDFRTAPLYSRYLRARLEGGAWGYGYANLSGAWSGNVGSRASRAGGGRPDRLTVLGAVSYRRSDGYRYNTDFWNLNAYSRVIYKSRRAGEFDIQGGFQRREWGSNGFYSLKYPDQFESTLTGLTSLRWTKSWRALTLEAKASFRQNNDQFAMVRTQLDKANYHTTYNTSSSLAASYDWRLAGVTTAGVSWTHNTVLSTGMGEPLDNPRHEIPGQGGRKYPKRAARDVTTGWIGHGKWWRGGWLQGQATVNHTPYGTAGAFFAEAGVQPGRVMAFKASALRSTRLPTFTELYYKGAGDYHPNSDLKPETAMTWRLTAVAVSLDKRWSGEASLWHRRTRNVIDWEQRPDTDPALNGHWWATQLNRLGTTGAEISARYNSDAGGGSGGGSGVFRLRTAMLSYGWLHSDMTVATNYISKYALDYMRHKVSASVGVGIARDFTLTLIGSFYDREGAFIAADGARKGYEPYLLLDGRLSWQRGGLQLYADATNLTGTRYFDFGGLPMPSTWLSAGVTITLRGLRP